MQYTSPESTVFDQELQKMEISTALRERTFLTLLLTFVVCACSDPRQLSYPTRLLLRPTVLRGGTSSRVQALLAYTGQEITTSSLSSWCDCTSVCLCLCVRMYSQCKIFPSSLSTMGKLWPMGRVWPMNRAGACLSRPPSLVRPTQNIRLNDKTSSVLFPTSSLSTSVQPQ